MNEVQVSSINFLLQEVGSLEKHIKQCLDRRSSGPDSSAIEFDSSKDYGGLAFGKGYYDLVCLLTLICYQPSYFGDFRCYLIYEIERYLDKNLLFPEIFALAKTLESKLVFSRILFKYSKSRNIRALYSAVLTEERINSVLSKIRFRYLSSKNPRRLVRHKGYRDHGTLRPPHRWLPSSDYSLNEVAKEIEEQKTQYHDTVHLILLESGDWYQRNRLDRKEDSNDES